MSWFAVDHLPLPINDFFRYRNLSKAKVGSHGMGIESNTKQKKNDNLFASNSVRFILDFYSVLEVSIYS